MAEPQVPAPLSEAERRRRELQGMGWITVDIFMVILTSVLAKQAGLAYPAVQIAFIRGLVGTVLMLPLAGRLWRMRGQITRPGIHVLRAAVGAASIVASFASLALLPLGVHIAATFTRPLIVLALAALLLKEAVGGRGWAAAIAGFAGVVIAVWPTLAAGDFGSMLGLTAAAGNVVFGAVAVIAVRLLAGDPRLIVMVGYTSGMILLLGPPAALLWEPVRPADWPMLIAIGLASQLGLFFFVSGQRLASAAALAPLAYLQLVLAPVAGYLVFGEQPTAWLFAGGALIIAAGLWNSWPRGPERKT